jgi:nicotinate-nucleotide adenylyltransferase
MDSSRRWLSNAVMRRIWFGGSFDPIHHGHLIAARAVAESAGFEHVVLVPNSKSPMKLHQSGGASAIDRLAMCRAATVGDPLFEVDGLELDRDPPSYTVDTVAELIRRTGEPISWLIGADSVAGLPGWHRWAAVLSTARFLVMGRPGTRIDWASLPPAVAKLQSDTVSVPLIDISSTDIRQRVASGRSIRNLVPRAVERLISEKGLYRALSQASS